MKYVVWGKNDTPRLPPVIPMNEKEVCHPRLRSGIQKDMDSQSSWEWQENLSSSWMKRKLVILAYAGIQKDMDSQSSWEWQDRLLKFKIKVLD